MGVIYRLPDEVASQVAAGEVVERPASIVKELVENSLDAGATRIDVEYQRGGSSFLAVTDDGRGMDRDDAVLCLERHATSKIRSGQDLERVMTFGFRGEALPSIASVSRFRLCTREHTADAGTEVVVTGGKIDAVRDSGEAPGTRIEVRSLFFNLPARKKFLRGERTEAAHIDHQFQTLALIHPERRFGLHRDGRQVHLLAPAASLADRARDLLGAEFAAGMFSLDETELQGITVRGLLGRPGSGRGDRTGQTIFINGRAVVSQVISQPLRDAYGSGMPRGMHPNAILFLTMDPALVDCNVHPAKREVRFRDGIAVREVVYGAVRQALENFRSQIIVKPAPFASPPAHEPQVTSADALAAPCGRSDPERRTPLVDVEPAQQVAGSGTGFSSPPPPERIVRTPSSLDLLGVGNRPEAFRFLGNLGDRYVVLEERDSGLVLLDNRAARERIVFEQVLRQIHSRQTESQRLLLPAVVELSPRDFQWTVDHAELLSSAGLLVERFGNGSVKVDGVPPMLNNIAVPDLLLRIVDDCRIGGRQGRSRALEESIARSLARSASLPERPHDSSEAQQLLKTLLECDLPYACPNGRPTMIHMSFPELDRKFGGTR